jgi:hypothetical protein
MFKRMYRDTALVASATRPYWATMLSASLIVV